MYVHGPVMLSGLERLERALLDDDEVTGDLLLLGFVLARAMILADPGPPPWDLYKLVRRAYGGTRAEATRRAITALEDEAGAARLRAILGDDALDWRALTASTQAFTPRQVPRPAPVQRPRLHVVGAEPVTPAGPHGSAHA